MGTTPSTEQLKMPSVVPPAGMCAEGRHHWTLDDQGPHCRKCPATPLDEFVKGRMERRDREEDPW